MADFAPILKHTLQWEGGFVNHPNDRGGATNKGVTLRTYRAYFGNHKTVDDLKKITDEEVYQIAYNGYWAEIRGWDIDCQSVADILFQGCWGSGCRTAIRMMQRILGVKADGICGTLTIKALNSYPDQRELFERYWKTRYDYFHRIVEKNPSQKVFLKGWINRLNSYVWRG